MGSLGETEDAAMSDASMCQTLPDLALHCVGGGDIDPADLRGQKVVIFFCPSDPAAAAREVEEFRSLAKDFADAGVWVLGVLEGALPRDYREEKGKAHISLAEDADGLGWSHFEPALGCRGEPDRSAGATFFFERWGTLGEAWLSSGHARDALKAARGRT
jgi:thioredoxin-dependent peroxiredoxin